MATPFTPELGDRILELIRRKNWKVCYEFRHHGDPARQQSMEVAYSQVAKTLSFVPRYHVFPGPLLFDEFSVALAEERLQLPKVTVANKKRILFGFGIREDSCFFVTNTVNHAPSADRVPKDYEFVVAALETLEEFIDRPEYRIKD